MIRLRFREIRNNNILYYVRESREITLNRFDAAFIGYSRSRTIYIETAGNRERTEIKVKTRKNRKKKPKTKIKGHRATRRPFARARACVHCTRIHGLQDYNNITLSLWCLTRARRGRRDLVSEMGGGGAGLVRFPHNNYYDT